jgi:hypothetical protein
LEIYVELEIGCAIAKWFIIIFLEGSMLARLPLSEPLLMRFESRPCTLFKGISGGSCTIIQGWTADATQMAPKSGCGCIKDGKAEKLKFNFAPRSRQG